LFLCCTIPDLRMASRPRRYSQPCTLSTCCHVGILDRKFRKSFRQEENRITESCRYSDAKHTQLCQGTSVVKLSHGHGNVFSLGCGLDRSFSYRLWDLETYEVVRSSDVVFNESAMHKATERPIELRRVTFVDIHTPLDGPT
jgi:hypothetical protein